MVKFEKLTTTPAFLSQFENKVLYSEHHEDISVTYKSTYTLKYVIEGTKHYSINHQDFEVLQNQYLLLNNERDIHTEAQKGTKGLSLFISPELIKDVHLFHSNNYNPSFHFFELVQPAPIEAIAPIIQELIWYFEQYPIYPKNELDTLFIRLSEIIVKQQMKVHDKFYNLNISKQETKNELYKTICMSQEYINDHVCDSINLADISKNIGLSKYYLHRLFTEIIGITPLAYLTSIRINKAKERLRKSNDPIFDIAISCGFENTAYFSNVFKKYVGTSPSIYRDAL